MNGEDAKALLARQGSLTQDQPVSARGGLCRVRRRPLHTLAQLHLFRQPRLVVARADEFRQWVSSHDRSGAY